MSKKHDPAADEQAKAGANPKWQNLADDIEATELGDNAETHEAALEYPSHEKLENQLTELENKYQEALAAVRYSHAELENTRKRAERDVNNAYKFGPEKLIKELLVIVDSLERSLEACDKDPGNPQAIREGVDLTLQMMVKVLEKFAVKAINPLGEVFNPEWHEAMSMQPAPNAKSGTITMVMQKGYTLHDRLLRPALVMVAK